MAGRWLRLIGIRWEYHVTQSERTLWRLQGLVPPALDSDAMKLWTEEGKAVPYVI